MITQENVNNIAGATVYGNDGSKIGSAKQVYLDDQSGRPEWVTVNTGLFGTSESFIPLSEASLSGDRLEVPFDKSRVKDAPQVGADGHLEPHEEDELYRYYGLSATTDTGTMDDRTDDVAAGGMATGMGDRDRDDNNDRDTVGRDTSGPTTDDAMTRSEERLEVGTESRQTGKARLRKHVVTENVTTTVPVSHEEVRLEREPITDANRGAAQDGPALSDEEHEVTLNEERVVVNKETVPVERVSVDKDTVTEQQTVNETVAKEQIDLDAADSNESTRR